MLVILGGLTSILRSFQRQPRRPLGELELLPQFNQPGLMPKFDERSLSLFVTISCKPVVPSMRDVIGVSKSGSSASKFGKTTKVAKSASTAGKLEYE